MHFCKAGSELPSILSPELHLLSILPLAAKRHHTSAVMTRVQAHRAVTPFALSSAHSDPVA